jgi:signal transduction histidine kinase
MAKSSASEVLVIRSWPKLIFMWPTAAVALAVGIMMMMVPSWENLWGAVFLGFFAFNLVVITFDFPRSTSLTVFVVVVVVILALILINQRFAIIGPVQEWLASRELRASRDFYFTIALTMTALFTGMMVVTRFDYWELTSNELIHHTGLLGDVERYSTAGLKLNTEINDVFEYLLAGAGRIIMNIPGTPRPVVLDNVLQISQKLDKSQALLSRRIVHVSSDDSPGDERERMAREYE